MIIILLASVNSFAQLNYRSRASGTWSTPTVWQVETSPNVWVTASSSPNFTANSIYIRSGHTVTISANITLDQMSVRDGGRLNIADGVTVTINNGVGNDFSTAANAQLHILGEGHIAGSGSAFLNGNIFVYSLNGTGAITAGTAATGNIRVLTRSYYTTTTINYVGAGMQYLGNGQPINSGIVINNLNGVTVNNTSTSLVDLSGLVRVNQGTLVIGNNNFRNSSTVEVNGGTIQFINSPSAVRSYTLNKLTINSGAANVLTTNGSNALNIKVNGALALLGGNLVLQSGAGRISLTTVNDITGTNKISASGNLNYFYLNGAGAISNPSPIAQSSTFKSLKIDRTGSNLQVQNVFNLDVLTVLNGGVTFLTNFTVQKDFNIASGTTVNFSNQTLTLNGPFNNLNSGGKLYSSGGGALVLGGSTVSATSLGFASGSILQSLTITRTGPVTLLDPVTISGALAITSASFNAGSNAMSVGSITTGGVFTAPSTTLTLSGNLNATNTFNLGACDLILSGTANQNISTANVLQFNDITLTKTAGTVYMNSSQNLSGVLTVSDGATFDADGVSNGAIFTLLSTGDDAGSDASIAALAANAFVVGDITVQRRWDAFDNRYRYISSPIENSPISQLQTSGIAVTGPFDGSSFPCTGCDNDYTNLGWYDETVTGYIWEGYKVMPSDGNDNSETLVPGRGYELYMWDGVNPSLWAPRGTVNQGSYSLEVSLTPSSPALDTEDGWNMVGNPYPSSISWNDNADLPGGWDMTNIDPEVWVWNVATQGWLFYDASSNSGTLLNGKIATGQAFWVHSLAQTTSLTVHEAAKTPVSGAYYRQRQMPLLAISVSGKDQIEDKAFLTLDESVRDIVKFSRGTEAISLALSSDEGKRLARFSTSNTFTQIPISVVFKNEGEYKFSFASEGSATGWESYYLVDQYMGTSVKLNSSYTFTVTKNAATTENRFFLSKTPEISKHGQTSASVVSVYPNPVVNSSLVTVDVNTPGATNVLLLNNVGQVVKSNSVTYEAGKGSAQFEVADLPKGLYYVKIAGIGQKAYIHKVIKQ